MLSLYDAFTITPILFLEDLGFCPKGEGGRFVAGGASRPGGKLPVNTNGGGLSYCHPGMYGLFVLIEAVRQVRGECGERQVPGLRRRPRARQRRRAVEPGDRDFGNSGDGVTADLWGFANHRTNCDNGTREQGASIDQDGRRATLRGSLRAS